MSAVPGSSTGVTAPLQFGLPQDVVPLLSKGGDNGTRHVLVGEQPEGHFHWERRGYTFSDCITALAYFRHA
jgi:hypothetical protein